MTNIERIRHEAEQRAKAHNRKQDLLRAHLRSGNMAQVRKLEKK